MPEGAARQAAQKEAVDAKKKKKAQDAQRKQQKELEIAQRVRAKENRSDVESELESEDPTEVGDDMLLSEEEESWEVVVTLAERHEPMTVSVSGK